MLRSVYSNTSGLRRQHALASIVGSAWMRGRRQAGLAPLTPGAAASGHGRKYRRVFTAQDSRTLPGSLMMQEGDQPSADVAVNEAYDGAGLTYDLFWQTYQRDSLDGQGLGLDSTVHYQTQYENAFWDGKQMVYGDGDLELFNRFTLAVDVIGHELTHGITQYTSNLDYSGESGALSESFSDIFGSLVKQWQRRQTAAAADWLVGEGIFTSRIKGIALRSMKEPGTAYDDPTLGQDPQPAHMRDYVVTLEDGGGVHVNSGIPNHAFFLTAVALGGYAWERAGRIWYVAARDKFKSHTDFMSAARLTHQVAEELYGADSPEAQAVRYGWQGVGIAIGARPQPQQSPGGCSLAPITALRSLVTRSKAGT